jgi:type II secretory ATPase GspE/PulE/Tfp pilus assembly ATPase PilB-like protein
MSLFDLLGKKRAQSTSSNLNRVPRQIKPIEAITGGVHKFVSPLPSFEGVVKDAQFLESNSKDSGINLSNLVSASVPVDIDYTEVIAKREIIVNGNVNNQSDVVFDKQQLGVILNYRSEVLGVVTKGIKDKCLVLDLGYNSAAILCVPDFFNSGQLQAVRLTLTNSRAMTIAHERIVEPTLLVSLIQEVQRATTKSAQSVDIAAGEDARNLGLFNDIISGAYLIGATDIHFSIGGDAAETALVRLRLFGRMSTWKDFPTANLKAALAAGYSAKSVAGTNSEPDWSVSKPCSTITRHEIVDSASRRRSVSGRFTSRPTVGGGCKVSVRLLDTDVRNVHIPSLVDLGYAPSQIRDQLMPALRKNEGCILIAGGTGSGKSTTLRTFMNELPDKERLERYSVEDPVEYRLPGVEQLSIQRSSDASDSKTKLQFTAALRDLMRMDPDVVMIGEIRDEETSTLTTEMVNTGHRVLTTVHGNDCIDVLDRMTGKTLAVPASSLGSGRYLLACLYQKLLPLLCPGCKRPAHGWLSKGQTEGVRRFGIDVGTLFVADPNGCSQCSIEGIKPTGTKGLTVVSEVLTPNRQMLELIRNREWPKLRDEWRSTRRTNFGDEDMTGKTAFEHAIFKMSRGLIDINDIESDFVPLDTYVIHQVQGA